MSGEGPPRPVIPEEVVLTVSIITTGKRETVEQIVARALDHEFRGRITIVRAETGKRVEFDPVLADGEPPPGYEPHPQQVVDHRPGRQP